MLVADSRQMVEDFLRHMRRTTACWKVVICTAFDIVRLIYLAAKTIAMKYSQQSTIPTWNN